MLQDFCRLYLYAAVSCDPVALRAGFQGCVGSMPVGGGSRSVVGWVMWPPVVCAGSRGNWGWFWFSCGGAYSGKSSISVFQEFSAGIGRAFILAGGGGGGGGAIILCGLGTFLIFPNLLGP